MWPNRTLCLTLALFVAACASEGVRIPVTNAEVVSQAALGPMGCGPCALYNSLLRGDEEHRRVAALLGGSDSTERVKSLILRYGQSPSIDYVGTRLRYDEKGGTTPNDLEALAQDLADDHGLPPVTGQRLERRKNETQEEQLRRVHRLLRTSALPPIVSVRSFVASKGEGSRPLWNAIAGHFLTVEEVGPLPPSGPERGFTMHCADSVNGRVIPVFVSIERNRSYTATLGFTVGPDGKEDWEWASGSPYLVATVPDLNLGTNGANWFERTVVVLRWALTDQ